MGSGDRISEVADQIYSAVFDTVRRLRGEVGDVDDATFMNSAVTGIARSLSSYLLVAVSTEFSPRPLTKDQKQVVRKQIYDHLVAACDEAIDQAKAHVAALGNGG
ncbi:MAG: hypothetical protein ACE5NA_12590 [Nitrospiraceae bacterium]